MYEQHFGLNKRPFSTIAAGPDVFVGPQTAKTMAALKKALNVPDAVAVVTGPVGVGKTTLVNRSLQAIGPNRIIISVGRMQLHHDDVLELLLDRLGLKQMPASTVQRFIRFRRLLQGLAQRNTRVFIVVEDAARIGSDTLSELEALTASDTGVSDGANLILMGEPDVNELIKTPQLARIKQRTRLRQSIAPLSNNEMRAYLKHSLRQAGGDLDGIFDENTSDLLHQHSGGIPRVVNNMVETVLEYASERKVSHITATFLTSVITDECGIADHSPSRNLAQTDAADPAMEHAPPPDSASTTTPAAEVGSDSILAPDGDAELPVPAIEAADSSPEQFLVNGTQSPSGIVDDAMPEAGGDNAEITPPDLIQDTFPSLAALKPELIDTQLTSDSVEAPGTTDSRSPDATPAPAPAPGEDKDIEPVIVNCELPDLSANVEVAANLESQTEDDGIPMLSNSMRLERPNFDVPPEIPSADVEISDPQPDEEPLSGADAKGIEDPECDSEPSIAELQPDLEALERAMAITQGSKLDLSSGDLSSGTDANSSLPEITLDKAIQNKIAEATELLEQTTIDLAEVAAEDAQIAADAAALESARPTGEHALANADMAELSSEMANLKTIEDVGEKMGETLFGDEFSNMAAQIAAHVAANPLPETSANDDSQPDPLSAELIGARSPAVVAESVVMGSELPETADISEIVPGASIANTDAAPERRFVTVTPLNAGTETAPADSEPLKIAPVAISEEPFEQEKTMTTKSLASMHQQGPLEDQISVSLTQTLKALNVSPPTIDDDDDDDDEDEKVAKGGFFSRFRRS